MLRSCAGLPPRRLAFARELVSRFRQECPKAKTPEVGEAAPDFTLPGVALTDGQAVRGEYALSGMRGTPVVLAFYSGDDTFVYTRQLCSYTAGLEGFAGVGATVWGISPQDVDSHERFARKREPGFPLLADWTSPSPGRTASAWGAAPCAGRCSSWTARARCGGST